MNDLLAQLARALNLPLAATIAVAGGIVGGAIYLHVFGVILGAVVALGLCGILAALAATIARLMGASIDAPHAPAAAAASVQAALPAQAASSHAATGHTAAASTVPAAGAVPKGQIEATESEAQLLSKGRFAEYHLAKAKRAFATQNYKEAAYQAGASLAHGDLAGAKELRKAALASAK